jgi:hypothetical protein
VLTIRRPDGSIPCRARLSAVIEPKAFGPLSPFDAYFGDENSLFFRYFLQLIVDPTRVNFALLLQFLQTSTLLREGTISPSIKAGEADLLRTMLCPRLGLALKDHALELQKVVPQYPANFVGKCVDREVRRDFVNMSHTSQ